MNHRKNCENKSLCEEKLSSVLPQTPPFFPRQYARCAIVGNSGDLIKLRLGKEIDEYDAVVRNNGAPVEVSILSSCSFVGPPCGNLRGSNFGRTILNMLEGKQHFACLIGGLRRL